MTIRRFGRTIKLYAPLYISNICINSCPYCNFNADFKNERKRLSLDEIITEAQFLKDQGHESLLLVSGEDPMITPKFLGDAISKLKSDFSEVSIEVQPLKEPDYRMLIDTGLDGVTLYQETYNKALYERLHTSGPKAEFQKRLDAIEAAARIGVRSINIGVLLGLSDWQDDMKRLFEHARFLMKKYWRSSIAISFPRLKHAPQGFKILNPVSDNELIEMICLTRINFPDSDLLLSTRETTELRDHLLGIGITKISAGSKNSPGGYSSVHVSEKQFELEDNRTTQEIINTIRRSGFDPVWKDWEL